jgi:hypothetical protein
MKPSLIILLLSAALVIIVAIFIRQRASARQHASTALTLEPAGQNDLGPCEHCGHNSSVVWGYIHRAGATRAAYFVYWTLGISEHPANFDLIIGEWGDATTPAQRVAVSLLYRNDVEQRSFMVTDAQGRHTDTPDMVGRALTRAEVVGTPLAEEVFTLVDFILLNDSRIGTIETKPPQSG